MKTIINISTSLLLLLVAIVAQAQTTPVPPNPPVTVSVHSDEGSSSYVYSETSKDGDGTNKKTNVSVSISNSDDSYSLRAKYPAQKYKEIKEVLTKEMSAKNHTISRGKDVWSSDSNGEEVYTISLSNKKVTMYLDKDIASSSLEEKFETLGKTIRTIIVGKQNESRREAERMQREADRIRRDAERMQREADRMQREAQRHAATISNQYRDDAARIADEARRLSYAASSLTTQAGHKGAISGPIRQLLGDQKTTYNESTKSGFNWTWPDAQNELLIMCKNDNLINTQNDVVFIKDETGIHVNGKHLSRNQSAKYNAVLARNNISDSNFFTFNKTHNHIVIVNDNPNLEGFINDALSTNIIGSANKKVVLLLNGNTAYKNGTQVTTTTLSKLNEILLENNIIPAPGKIFEIMKPKNYKLGYALGPKSHLGTWQMTH